MKFFILFLLFCVAALPAFATPITPEKGQQYYTNCMATPDPRLLPGTQNLFCQCTEKFMLQNMSYEDLVGLKNNERVALNKMMITVYAPCMEMPVHDKKYQDWIGQGVPAAQSECIATGLAKYTAVSAQQLLTKVLAQYPGALEPVAAITQTPEFEAQEKMIVQQCGGQR